MSASRSTSPTYAMGGNERRTRIVVLITVLTMVVELVVGRLTGSMALWADGWHMASHAGALGLTLFGYAFARRHAQNPRYTFGVGKVFSLVGFGSAIALSFVSLEMVGESAVRLVSPVPIEFEQALPVAVVGLLVNLACAVILMKDESQAGSAHHDGPAHAHTHSHSHAHGAETEGDHNLRAAFLHVLADALTSVAAIGALLGGRMFGWNSLDPIMGILGGLMVARWGLLLVRDTARVLLDERLDGYHARVLAAVDALPGVHEPTVHVWRLGPGAIACAVTVQARASITPTLREVVAQVHPFAWLHCMVEPSHEPTNTPHPSDHAHDHSDHPHGHQHR